MRYLSARLSTWQPADNDGDAKRAKTKKRANAKRGQQAEDRAAKLLRRQGYRIVCRNYSSLLGEIDVVAEDDRTLVFVEVRLRTRDHFGDAASTVTRGKQRKVIAAAHDYLARHPTTKDVRFDVVAITGDELQLIEGAFEA